MALIIPTDLTMYLEDQELNPHETCILGLTWCSFQFHVTLGFLMLKLLHKKIEKLILIKICYLKLKYNRKSSKGKISFATLTEWTKRHWRQRLYKPSPTVNFFCHHFFVGFGQAIRVLFRIGILMTKKYSVEVTAMLQMNLDPGYLGRETQWGGALH